MPSVLASSGVGEPARLGEQLGRATGDERAAERRDGAERAAAVTAGGDLERGRHAAREPLTEHRGPGGGRDAGGQVGQVNACLAGSLAADGAHGQQRAAVPGDVGGPLPAREHVIEAGRDVGVVIEAEHLGVDVLTVKRGGKLAAVTLGQAANGRHPGARVGRLHDGVDGFLLGRLDEAARVNEDDVRFLALAP